MTAAAINVNQSASNAIHGTDTSANGQQPAVTPQEIGMMFVHEYYNFLHDDPQKLHLFYNKNSSYLHGDEGDLNVKLVNGNQVRVQNGLAVFIWSWCLSQKTNMCSLLANP